MATSALKAVDVYPELRDPDLRSFSDAAVAVCSLYGDAVRPARLAARHFLFSMSLFPVDHGSAVRLCLYDDVPDAEIGNVMVPSGVARLSAPVVALLVLDVVHAAMTELGRLRGWDRAVLDAARAHAVAEGLVWKAATDWKRSRDRKHRARAVWRTGHDGVRRGWIEVERTTDGALVGLSSPITASPGWRVHNRSLRWQGNAAVSLASGDPVFHGQALEFALPVPNGAGVDSPYRAPEPEPPLTARRPAVVLAPPPPRRRISGPSVSTTKHVLNAYLAALDVLVAGVVEGADWDRWWSAADRDELEIWCDLSGSPGTHPMDLRTGVYARRTKDKLIARIERTFPTAGESALPVDLAHRDVVALLDLVRATMSLPAYPSVPSVAEVRVAVGARWMDHEDERRRIGALLRALGDRLPVGVTAGLREWLAEGMLQDCVGALFHQVRSNGVVLSPAERRELDGLGRLQVHGRDREGTTDRPS